MFENFSTWFYNTLAIEAKHLMVVLPIKLELLWIELQLTWIDLKLAWRAS